MRINPQRSKEMRRKTPRWKNGICLLFAVTLLATAAPTSVQAEQEYWPEGPSIDTPSAIVMEMNSGTILYEKAAEESHYPASITKIMTTMLALEHCELSEIVTFSKDAVYKTPSDSSHIARDVGEQMTMEQCLYAVMLESANECAYAVAEHVGQKLGGDYQTFIDLMNQKAQELGCTNTHFNNSNGLHDNEHWTCARDMALIASAAYENETFRIITGTKKYQIPPTNKHDVITYLVNHQKLLHRYKDSNEVYEYCTGGKTGYTNKAKNTLVTYAEKDGLSLVCVVMYTTSSAQWDESRELLEYCFQNFKAFTIAEHENAVLSNDVNKGVMNSYGSYVSLDSSAYVVLPAMAAFSDAECKQVDVEGSGTTIAQLQYTYAGRHVGSVDIVASGVKVEDSYFDSEKEDMTEEDKKVVKVEPLVIVGCVAAVVIVLAIIILCKRFYDNYYVILHNMEVKRQRKERFRPISKKKRRWRKSDRMFR